MSEVKIERFSGRIKTMSERGNYGYIMAANGKEIFLHETDASFTPIVGMYVTFQIGEDRRGRKKAVNVNISERVHHAEEY